MPARCRCTNFLNFINNSLDWLLLWLLLFLFISGHFFFLFIFSIRFFFDFRFLQFYFSWNFLPIPFTLNRYTKTNKHELRHYCMRQTRSQPYASSIEQQVKHESRWIERVSMNDLLLTNIIFQLKNQIAGPASFFFFFSSSFYSSSSSSFSRQTHYEMAPLSFFIFQQKNRHFVCVSVIVRVCMCCGSLFVTMND